MESLRQMLECATLGDSVILLGDFNARMGNDIMTWKGVTGRNGLPDQRNNTAFVYNLSLFIN